MKWQSLTSPEFLELLAVLLGLYLLEGIILTPLRSAAIVYRRSGPVFTRAAPWLSGLSRGLVYAGLLPWRRGSYILPLWPVASDGDTASEFSSETLAVDDWPTDTVARDSRVTEIAAQIRRANDSGGLDAWLDDHMDASAIEIRARDFERSTRWLRALATAQVVLTIGGLAVVVGTVGLSKGWRVAVVCAWGLTPSIAWLQYRLNKRFYPQRVSDRWSQFFTALLVPTSAMRPVEPLSRMLLVGYHPVVAAYALRARGWKRQLHHASRDGAHPLASFAPSDEASRIDRAWRQAIAVRLRAAFEDSIDTEPVATHQGVHECPRCGAIYNSDATSCRDCPGIEFRVHS